MDLREQLASRMQGKVVVLGIGNPCRGDDAAGSLVAQMLNDEPNVCVIDAQDVPEHYLYQVADDVRLGLRQSSMESLWRSAWCRRKLHRNDIGKRLWKNWRAANPLFQKGLFRADPKSIICDYDGFAWEASPKSVVRGRLCRLHLKVNVPTRSLALA